VHHFDSKAEVEEYIREQNIPASFIMPAVFMTFMLGNFRPTQQDNSVYAINMPFPSSTKMPMISPADDIGLFAAAALWEGPQGKRIAVAADTYTIQELADTYAGVTGRKTLANDIGYETFGSFLPPNAKDELTGNMQLIQDPGYYVGEPSDTIEQGHALIKKAGFRDVVSWKDYVTKHWKEQ
jgi:uncharacterized protein YbjT (DUF2867 family)